MRGPPLRAVLLLASLGFLGSGCSPPKDSKNSLPTDAVRNFIERVQAKDYVAAKRLWYGSSKLVATSSDPADGIIDARVPFETFCAEFQSIDLEQASMLAAPGKSGFWGVNVDWVEGGMKKHYHFGLKIVDGEWKIERGYHW